jgi:hypothetical protein
MGHGDWDALVRDLGDMIMHFLLEKPAAGRGKG